MSLKKQVAQANDLLSIELGKSATGMSNYVWRYSEDWLRPMRVVDVINDIPKPRYDQVLNPETGLYEVKPTYITRKVCEELDHRWVMTKWMSTGDFRDWRKLYDDNLEWPKGGEYFPVNAVRADTPGRLVCLGHGEEPGQLNTWEFIHAVKQTQAELAEYEQRTANLIVSREKSRKDHLIGEITNLLPVHLNIPGKRSFPIWSGVGRTIDPRVSAESQKSMLGEN